MIGFSEQLEKPDKPLESIDEKIREGLTQDFTCYYLLAAAGSGKTHHLMDVLSKEFGFYLSSGAINDRRGALFSPYHGGINRHATSIQNDANSMAAIEKCMDG